MSVRYNSTAISHVRPTVLQRQDKASNLFFADVSQSIRAVPGVYQLAAVLQDGWDESTDRLVPECTLSSWVVEVQDSSEAQLRSIFVLGISAAGCLVLIAVLVCFLKLQGDRFQHIFHMVVFESVKLIFGWAFEIADIVTDTISFLRAVVLDSVRAEYTLPSAYKISYSCFFGISVIVSATALVERTKHCWGLKTASQRHDDSAIGRIDLKSIAKDDDTKYESLQSKLRWEVDKSKRELKSNLMTLLTVLLEDIPFIVINGALLSRAAFCALRWLVTGCAHRFHHLLAQHFRQMGESPRLWVRTAFVRKLSFSVADDTVIAGVGDDDWQQVSVGTPAQRRAENRAAITAYSLKQNSDHECQCRNQTGMVHTYRGNVAKCC
jgi:hypothetical protein